MQQQQEQQQSRRHVNGFGDRDFWQKEEEGVNGWCHLKFAKLEIAISQKRRLTSRAIHHSKIVSKRFKFCAKNVDSCFREP